MQRIALIYGGASSEHSVSCVTAVGVSASMRGLARHRRIRCTVCERASEMQSSREWPNIRRFDFRTKKFASITAANVPTQAGEINAGPSGGIMSFSRKATAPTVASW